MSQFPYLGSLITEGGQSYEEMDRRIASVSRAFGALRRAFFKDSNLSVKTKRSVYNVCVMSVLLFGSECWVPLRRNLKRLSSFHHRCVHTVFGITNQRQWEECISSVAVREQWGDIVTIEIKLMRDRLEWLGHLVRIQDHTVVDPGGVCLFRKNPLFNLP